VGTFPAILVALFAGAISDRFGRKPLMIVALLGFILDDVTNLVHYNFIRY